MLWWLSSIRIPKSNGSQAIKRWLRSVRIFSRRGIKTKPCFHRPLCIWLDMIGAFLFVPDTPKCGYVKRKGSHQTVSSELTPRESHPNCRSDRAALIACGELATARTVTGREYHCPLCGSWRNRGLPDILSR